MYAVALCPVSYHDCVGESGFNDSKALTEARREELFHLMDGDEKLGYATLALSPAQISSGMLRRVPHNLNAQSLQATVELIAGILDKVQVKAIYVDTVGDPERYKRTLQSYFNIPKYKDIEWVVASKADATYPVTGAASIAAKVTRDELLKRWAYPEPGLGGTTPLPVSDEEREVAEDEEDAKVPAKRSRGKKGPPKKRAKKDAPAPGVDEKAFWVPGSGYPSDPNTSTYLERVLDPVFGWPNIVRFSWATCKNLLIERTRTELPRTRGQKCLPTPVEKTEQMSPFGTILPTGTRAYHVRWVDEPVTLTSFFGKSQKKDKTEWEDVSQLASSAHSKVKTGVASDLGLQPTSLGFF